MGIYRDSIFSSSYDTSTFTLLLLWSNIWPTSGNILYRLVLGHAAASASRQVRAALKFIVTLNILHHYLLKGTK
jgi:hypothetical protein